MYTIADLRKLYEAYKAIVAIEDRSVPGFLAWLESS
jgi:hypothetical protein